MKPQLKSLLFALLRNPCDRTAAGPAWEFFALTVR
jgi:hypothetical protein